MVDEYESDSDLDPDDVRIFEEGFTHTMVREGCPLCILEIPSDLNLLWDT